jgi:hypothetical protein
LLCYRSHEPVVGVTPTTTCDHHIQRGQDVLDEQRERLTTLVEAGKTAIQGSHSRAHEPVRLRLKKRKESVIAMKITRNIGMLLLSIWLIAWGLSALVPALGGLGVILAILAIAAGIFILLGR